MKRLILFLVIFGFAYNASATPHNTSAEIVTSITIPEQILADFGSFTVNVVGGAFTIDAVGTISPAPNRTLLGGDQGGVAQLVTAGIPALATVTVTAIAIGTTRASEVDTMVIVGICRGPGATLDADNSNCTFRFNEVIADAVNIGGKVTLSASANPPVFMLKP